MGSYTIEQLSSLKESSSFDKSWYKYELGKRYGRKRAAEAVRPLITGEKCTEAIQLLTFALQKVEEQEAMHVCIFKKSQHGGLGEIYVIGMSQRNVQLVCSIVIKWISQVNLQCST